MSRIFKWCVVNLIFLPLMPELGFYTQSHISSANTHIWSNVIKPIDYLYRMTYPCIHVLELFLPIMHLLPTLVIHPPQTSLLQSSGTSVPQKWSKQFKHVCKPAVTCKDSGDCQGETIFGITVKDYALSQIFE